MINAKVTKIIMQEKQCRDIINRQILKDLKDRGKIEVKENSGCVTFWEIILLWSQNYNFEKNRTIKSGEQDLLYFDCFYL